MEETSPKSHGVSEWVPFDCACIDCSRSAPKNGSLTRPGPMMVPNTLHGTAKPSDEKHEVARGFCPTKDGLPVGPCVVAAKFQKLINKPR